MTKKMTAVSAKGDYGSKNRRCKIKKLVVQLLTFL